MMDSSWYNFGILEMYSSQSVSGGDPSHLSRVLMRLPLICTVFKELEDEDEHDVDASDVDSGEFGSDWITPLFAGVVGSLIVVDQFKKFNFCLKFMKKEKRLSNKTRPHLPRVLENITDSRFKFH